MRHVTNTSLSRYWISALRLDPGNPGGDQRGPHRVPRQPGLAGPHWMVGAIGTTIVT